MDAATRQLMAQRTVTARVRCMGKMHCVAFTVGDQDLVLLDHQPEELPRLLDYNAVHGDCRCAQVYQAWKTRNALRIPPRLRHLMPVPPPRPRASDFTPQVADPALRAETARSVAVVLGQCSYRRSVSRWGGGQHYVEVAVVPRSVPCRAQGHREDDHRKDPRLPGGNSVLKIRVREDWLPRVVRPGLAALPLQRDPRVRLLVLDVLRDDLAGLFVLAVRPNGGFAVRAWPAKVVSQRRALRWLGSARGQEALDAYDLLPTPE
jgi:hypothetical protein